jgi:hypothetical protein
MLATTGSILPVVLIAIEQTVHVIGLEFGPREKYMAYGALWDEWVPQDPQVIITVNDSYIFDGPAEIAPQYFGKPLGPLFEAHDPYVKESLSIMVFPRGANAWAVVSRYTRVNGKITFQLDQVNRNDSGDMLGGDLGPAKWLGRANIAYDMRDRKRRPK